MLFDVQPADAVNFEACYLKMISLNILYKLFRIFWNCILMKYFHKLLAFNLTKVQIKLTKYKSCSNIQSAADVVKEKVLIKIFQTMRVI